MRRLHLFNPENDMALASGLANFTPPKTAAALRDAGRMLPLWYAGRGDQVIAFGCNRQWFESIETMFDTGVGLFSHGDTTDMEAAPWGWSEAARRIYMDHGMDAARLPDDAALQRLRMLSHRRTAIALRETIARLTGLDIAPAAVEVADIPTLSAILSGAGAYIIKAPWSSSGRGLTDTRRCNAAEVLRRSAGIVARQGSVTVEPAHDRIVDFAMLYNCDSGTVSFTGFSLFDTDESGNYRGNVLASDAAIVERLGRLYSEEQLYAVSEAAATFLTEHIAPHYNGCAGIDMLLARKPDGTVMLDANVELNLRVTMGFVAHSFYRRFVADGSIGRFTIIRQQDMTPADNVIVDRHRMVSGSLCLTPPGGLFRFVAEVDTL